MKVHKTVGIIGEENVEDCLVLLSALAQSCGLSVRRADLSESHTFAGFIVIDPSNEKVETAKCPTGRPSIRIIPSNTTVNSASVHFSNSRLSPIPFQGRTLTIGSAVPVIPQDSSGEIIATADNRPIWTSTTKEGVRYDICGVSRPWIKAGECVFSHLNGSRLMNLLPLLEWLRSISDWGEWKQPALRACLMFDDPNLHDSRFGFINYGQLAAEGRRLHYHTSFATVPLDGYYANQAAARIFQENHETLSFLIHGNNHTYRELSGQRPHEEQLAQMQQAITRISKLEKKSGVAISRVMAPPHGVCSAEMMAAMRSAGFEAVCVSHGSVWTGNPGAEWAVSLGASPVMVVAGLPVIPRFGLNRKPENQVLLAAYLNQPIIPVGHHWDLADGTDILTTAAQVINGLGKVRWSNMGEIARSNYRYKITANLMHVQSLARITTVSIPEGVTELALEAPWLDPINEHIECRMPNGIVAQRTNLPSPESTLKVVSGETVNFMVVQNNNAATPVCSPRTPLGAIARRVIVELRDRSMPYMPNRFVRR